LKLIKKFDGREITDNPELMKGSDDQLNLYIG